MNDQTQPPQYPNSPPPYQSHQYQAQPQPPIVGWQPIYAQAFPQQKPPASGFKIATGILAIFTGLWVLFASLGSITASFSFDVGFFMLTFLGGLATFILGIVQLAMTRRARHHIPKAILWLSSLGILVSVWQVLLEYWSIPNSISLLLYLATAVMAMVSFLRKPKHPQH